MAYNISVAVGDNDTMARGRALIWTVPLAAEMDVGNDPVALVSAPAEPFEVLLQEATSNPSPAQTASNLRCERLFM